MSHEPIMKTAFLIFPHQLFADTELLRDFDELYLIEEFLFFAQYRFHKQKLLLHRASMQYYKDLLLEKGFRLKYIEAAEAEADVRLLIQSLGKSGVQSIGCYDVCDNWLEKRLHQKCAELQISLKEFNTPLFLNNKEELKEYFETKSSYFQTDFYIRQRKKWKILLDENGKALGGKWSFDSDNREKYPKDKKAPKRPTAELNNYHIEAAAYVQKRYPDNPGQISEHWHYPCTHEQSRLWMQTFFEERFSEFGIYEDAIVAQESVLHHSVLTPMLNIGLLLPGQVVQAALDYAAQNDIPLNSLEGFIRQIIGWREFIRGVYLYQGTTERKRNFWEFDRKMPAAFYTGDTGIAPIDQCIRKLLQTGYNHHIERLMILGNFMLLNEIHPDAVYRWFMELYIDAYDWVMVPNICGMSQFADGGLMATKPYISGSAYVLKMSNFPKGDWCSVWDALFWEFMNKQRAFFSGNPRLGMLLKTYDKMSIEKKQLLSDIAERFIKNIC